MESIQQLQQERDLYLHLLALGTSKDVRSLLEEALSLIVEVTGAAKGYLALYEEEESPRFFIARGFLESELGAIQKKISRGIIAQAMATGQVISTPAATSDTRFQDNSSVERNQISAVLCAPIGIGEEPLGVLYLQDREPQGSFSAADIQRASLFTQHLAPFVDRLLVKEKIHREADATAAFRKRLKLDGLLGRSRSPGVYASRAGPGEARR